MAQVWVGRFGYSDLKEAALSGAAAMGVGWSLAGLVGWQSGFAEPLSRLRAERKCAGSASEVQLRNVLALLQQAGAT